MLVKITDIERLTKDNKYGKDTNRIDAIIAEFIDAKGIDNIIGRISGQVYGDYVEFCKSKKYQPITHMGFARRLYMIANLGAHSKRIDGKVYRVIVPKDEIE